MKIKKEKDDGRCSKEKVIFLYFYPTSNKTNRKHIFFSFNVTNYTTQSLMSK